MQGNIASVEFTEDVQLIHTYGQNEAKHTNYYTNVYDEAAKQAASNYSN